MKGRNAKGRKHEQRFLGTRGLFVGCSLVAHACGHLPVGSLVGLPDRWCFVLPGRCDPRHGCLAGGVVMTDKLLIDRATIAQALEFLEAGNFVYPTQLATALRAALAEPDIDPVDEYRKGFIAGQIDMRDRPAEPETPCRRAICQRGPDGYCAPCHERMYP
jgi:hypothetical protein